MSESLKKIAGPVAFIITIVIGIGLGYSSLDNNPDKSTHKILDGMALRIIEENKIEDWGAKETSIVTYSMLAKPITSLNKTLHMLYWLLGSGGIGAALNMILDRLLIP